VIAPPRLPASLPLAHPGLFAARRRPRRAVVLRDREGKEEDERAGPRPVEWRKSAGERGSRTVRSPPSGEYFK